MIAAYVDASVVLRVVLEQEDPLAEWNLLAAAVSSELARVECYRGLERLWRQHQLNDEQLETARRRVQTMLRNVELIRMTRPVLALAPPNRSPRGSPRSTRSISPPQ